MKFLISLLSLEMGFDEAKSKGMVEWNDKTHRKS